MPCDPLSADGKGRRVAPWPHPPSGTTGQQRLQFTAALSQLHSSSCTELTRKRLFSRNDKDLSVPCPQRPLADGDIRRLES